MFFEAAVKELSAVEQGTKKVLLDGSLIVASEPISKQEMTKLLAAADKLAS